MIVINFITNLMTNFEWLGGTLIKITAFMKIFNTVNGMAQNIVKNVSSAVAIFTAKTTAQVTATNSATVAQQGLNTAMTANPYGIVASAVSFLISMLAMLSIKIDEVNEKAGGVVGGGGIRTQYDAGVRDFAKREGIELSTAGEITSKEEELNSEIEKIQAEQNAWVDLVMGSAKEREIFEKLDGGTITQLSKASPKTYQAVVSSLGNPEVIQGKDGDWMFLDEYKKKNEIYREAKDATNYLFGTNNKIKEAKEQFEKEKFDLIHSDHLERINKNNEENEWQKLIDEMNDRIKGLKAGGGALAPKGKTDVGTVDKIKDTVDVTDEDLKFMRDFAEREVINKIQTTALSPQINVEFSGEIKETVDVNEMIGKVTEELENVIHNSAAGVHL